MSTQNPDASRRYRIHLTETRVYALEITSDTAHDLETWARDGWAAGGAVTDGLELVDCRLEKVTVSPADALPWNVRRFPAS